MGTGRSIRIHLADGNPKGVRVAHSPVRTCRVAACPRTELSAIRELVESVAAPGVYILVGEDPKQLGRSSIYIGESENVFERVRVHLRSDEKEFQDVVFIVSTSDFLTKAHISWLERELIRLCLAADVATVMNANDGLATTLPKSDTDDLKTFLDDLRLMLPVLGFDFARDPIDLSGAAGSEGVDSPVFVFSKRGATARMRIVDGEYVVLQGSTATRQGTPSWDTYIALRDSLVESKKLVPDASPDLFRFAESVPFQSPSAAATVVAAANQPGPIVWKVEGSGATLREWEASRLDS